MRLIVLLSVLALLLVPALAIGAGEGMGDPKAMKGQQMEGTISSIDMQNKIMHLQPSQAGQAPMTLYLSDKTQVMGAAGAAMNWNQLKEGDRIRASFMKQDGKDMANKVEVLSPGGAAAPRGGAAKPSGGGM
jgi:Cu/Ag efflux protein CusF